MRWVIVSLDSLGDIVLRQPLIKALMDRGDEVTLVIQQNNATLIPYLENRVTCICTTIYPYATPTQETLDTAENLLRQIQATSPDAIVIAPFSYTYLDEWLLTRMHNIPRYGFLNALAPENTHSMLLSHACTVHPDMLDYKKNACLFNVLTGESIEDILPALTVPPSLIDEAKAILHRYELEPFQYVIGAPTGIANVSAKRWPEKSFADCVFYIQQKYNVEILLTGSVHEHALLQHIATLLSQKNCPVSIWVGNQHNIGLFLALIKLSRFYIGNDSGPMHFAAALEKPIVALFGGGTWPRFLPAARRCAVIAQMLPCYGCAWNCIFGDARCLSGIPIEQIMTGIDWIISDAPDEAKIFEEAKT